MGHFYLLLSALAIVFIVVVPATMSTVLREVLGNAIANLGSIYMLVGNDRFRPKLMAFMEWESPGVSATLLMVESDDVAALVLARLSPRYRKKVIAEMPMLRQKSIEYWLEHPQAFPRWHQQAVASRMKKTLRRAESA